MRRPSRGVVSEFDEDRGLGTVRDEVGRELPFHCTAIADGTRSIVPGTPVSFLTAPGHLGRMEARGLVPEPAAQVGAAEDPAGGLPAAGFPPAQVPPAGDPATESRPVPETGAAPDVDAVPGVPMPPEPGDTTTIYLPPPPPGPS